MNNGDIAIRSLLFTLLVVVILTLVGTAASAQLHVTAVTAEKDVTPGEFVSLVFSAVNDSGAEREVDFSLSVPEGWAPMNQPPTKTMAPGDKETIFLNIQVPATAGAGNYSVKLTGTYDTQEFSASATVSVKEIKGVEVDAPPAKTVSRDTELTYTFTVKNTGNVTDTFRIEADSGHDWVTSFSPDNLNLFPGQSKEVEVAVYVPDDAVPGRDPVTVTATSVRNEDITDEDTVSTQILPPSPQAVGGELYAIIPASLEGGVGGSLDEGVANGNLSLTANGELGNGNLYFDFGLSDLFEDDSVEWNAFDYGEENYQISTGNVGLSFSQLLSKYGRGISASLELGDFSLSLIDLFGGLLDSGARLSCNLDDISIAGNLSNVKTGEEEYKLTGSVVGNFARGEVGELELEAGYTPSEGNLGSAFRGYGQADLELLTLKGEGFFIGPRFAGSNSGDKGFRVTETTGGDNFDQEISYSYLFETPSEVQTKSVMKTDRLSASLTLDLLGLSGSWPEGKRGRSFRLSGFYELSNEEDLRPSPTLDETTQRIRASFLYRYNDFEYLLVGSEGLRTNHLSEESFNSSTLDHSLAYYFDGFTFRVNFSNGLTENLTTGETVATSGGTEFELVSTGSPYVDIGLTKNEEDVNFSLVSTIAPSENFELSVGGDASFGRGEMDFGASLDFTYEYDLPLKFIITKGRLDGYVFVDDNGNGKKDEDENGVPELVLTVENTKVASGEDGYFKFPPFIPGRYDLAIEDLPSKYGSEIELPKEVEVKKGDATSVPVPLTELSNIKITVFSDDNESGTRNSGERGWGGIGFTLTGDEVDKRRVTNEDGVINFRGLLPGEYSLKLDEETLPPRSEITAGKTDMTFELAGGDTKKIVIGNFQRPREIIFGQPPEADFTYSPGAPGPDTQVNFSGGLSTDPDGEITEYSWDFQSDGEVDETGKIVSYTFESPGSYEVTLTVVDNEGNEATATKTIEVVENQ